MTRRLVPTAQVTTGPFFPAQFIQPADSALTRGTGTPGQRIALSGKVTDADGRPCVNVILEIWQANADGRLAATPFHGWGRTWTDEAGLYRFLTIRPGAVSSHAPSIGLMIHASGLMRPLVTRIYFPDEPRNLDDPQLAFVPPARRIRLVARISPDAVAPSGGLALCFDVDLAGPDETPFLAD